MAILTYNARFSWCSILLVFAITVMSVKAQSSCNTPRGESGMCVPYKKCSLVNTQFERYGNALPKSFAEEIRRRHCSQFRSEIYICCELRYAQTATDTVIRPARSGSLDQSTDNNDGNNQAGLSVLKSMNCGKPPDNRVSFGEAAKLGEYPWMALIRYDDPEPFQCGGSLITERFVLTAAHCIFGQKAKVIGVRLGEHDISKELDCQTFGATEKCLPPVEDFGVEKIITHESYERIKNDIALIRLDRNVECKRHIQTVCLPITSKSRVLQQDQDYIIAGWGRTEIDNIRSKVLLKAVIPHLTLETCHNTYKNDAESISDTHLCAGGRNRQATCRGDSGGPLFFLSSYDKIPRFVQYGIVSFGVPACGPKESYPTLFTKVEAYLPWITSKLAEYQHTPSRTCSRR